MVTASSLTSQKSAVTWGTRFATSLTPMANSGCMQNASLQSICPLLFRDDLEGILEECIGTLVIVRVATLDSLVFELRHFRLVGIAKRCRLFGIAQLLENILAGHGGGIGGRSSTCARKQNKYGPQYDPVHGVLS